MTNFENCYIDASLMQHWDRKQIAEFFYLAGQADTEQRVREVLDAADVERREALQQAYTAHRLYDELQAKCAELERERDQWKYTAEIRQQHLEYTIKAQAGEPDGWIDGGGKLQELNPDGFEDWQPLYTHPKPVKVQAGEPVVFTQFLTDVITCAGLLSHGKRDKGLAKRISDEACRLMMSHPTTERPYNPLNDYAVISMNPTEPVKAQAGEHRPVARVNRQGFIVEMDDIQMAEGTLLYMHPTTEPVKAQAGEPTYTTGHCENHKHPKGCQLHNLHCGYPACDRKAATHPTTERPYNPSTTTRLSCS